MLWSVYWKIYMEKTCEKNLTKYLSDEEILEMELDENPRAVTPKKMKRY